MAPLTIDMSLGGGVGAQSARVLCTTHSVQASTSTVSAPPSAAARVNLMSEVITLQRELMLMRDGWRGPTSKAPNLSVIESAMRVAEQIVHHMKPVPRSLNLAAAEDGSLLFSLFGRNGREADLWIGPIADGSFRYVATSEDGEDFEGALSVRRFKVMARWLSGQAASLPHS